MCRSPNSREIDAALVSGAPVMRLAAHYGLSEPAMRRHADAHLPARLAKAAHATEVAEAGGLLGRVERLLGDLEILATEARDEGNRDAFLRVSRELVRALELVGRVSGAISTTTTVNVLHAQPGVSVEEAKRAVRVVQTVEVISDDEVEAEAIAWLRARGRMGALCWPWDYIVAFHNRSRRHGHLGGVSPEQFETAHKVRRQGVH